MGTLPLFEEPGGFDRERLRRRLEDLARQGVFIGTSSWKYPGWLDQVYTRERYCVRGRFSQRLFEQACLAEYAETFPVVCGDFTFYQFPTPEYWAKLFGSAPRTLRYAFKVPEEITVKAFPVHARYAARAGLDNPSFLDAAMLETMFLDPLRPYRHNIAALIFEFGTFPKRCYEHVRDFAAELDQFLSRLPRGFRYAVEIRNEEFLAPEYFAVLRAHRVAHVLNAWTRMPPLDKVLDMPEIYTTDFTLVRALLRTGRAYEDAVARFSPYEKVQDENPPTRAALRQVIRDAIDRRMPAYIFVNNRLEGNAPGTIESLAG